MRFDEIEEKDDMLERLTGIVLLLLGAWEFYTIYKSFLTLKGKGGKSASNFIPLALLGSGFFGLALFVVGILLMFKQF